MIRLKNRARGLESATWALLFAALAAGTAGAEEIYYQNDFQNKCDIVFWAQSPTTKVQVDEIGLADESPFQGKRCAKIVFHVVEETGWYGWCYFKIPLDVKIDPAKSYVAEADMKYQSNSGCGIGFGHSWQFTPKGKTAILGNFPSAGMDLLKDEWVRLASGDLMAESYRANAKDLGYPPDCPGKFDALYIHTDGFKTGDKITIWLDNVKLRSATDEDRARREKEKRPFDYVPPSYPKVEEATPWGVYGSLEFHAGTLGVPLEIEAAVAARHWAQFGWDTAVRGGGMVLAPGSAEEEDYLGRWLDVHAKHDIQCVPSTYLTGYYNRKVPREKCEEAIRRVVLRYREHPALMAWWMIDEPVPPLSNLRDQWIWGKQQFEALDTKHPALGALCWTPAVNMFSQYMQVAIIDCYPLLDTHGNATTVATRCEQSWSRGARRIWAVPQAFGETPPWRLPSPAELRLMTWLYLARGSTGFVYYAYAPTPAWLSGWGHRGLVDLVGQPTEMGQEVLRLAADVPSTCAAMAPARWTPDARVSVECDKGEDGKPILDVGRMTGEAYDVVIVSNLDTKSARAGKVRIEQEKDRTLYDLRALKPVTAESDGAMALSLQAGDAAVLLSGDAKGFAEAKKLVLARRLELLKRDASATVAEARANGVPAATWDAELTRAGVAEKQQDYAEAIAAAAQARHLAEAALLADAGYAACRQPFDRGTQALSRASRALELQALPLVNGKPDALKLLQADAVFMTHAKTLKELARCQHLLRYALLTGKTADMAAPCRDLDALAAQAEAGVAAFATNRAEAKPDAAPLKRLADAVAGIKP